MKREIVERYVWNKDEIFRLLLANLQSRGIEVVEGESSLSLSGMTVVLEFWGSRMPRDKTSGESEEERPPGELFKRSAEWKK